MRPKRLLIIHNGELIFLAFVSLKGQSHKKVGEIRVRAGILGPN
jgi:hypothetical protein